MCHRKHPQEDAAMAKHVSGKNTRGWQVSSVWVKRRDGPERVLSAYRLLLDLPPRRTVRLVDHLELNPRPERQRTEGKESEETIPHAVPRGGNMSESHSETS
jgi:hypothetical protein